MNFQQFITEFTAELSGKKPTKLAHSFCQMGIQGPNDPYCCVHGWKCEGNCSDACNSFFNPVYNKKLHRLLAERNLILPLRRVMKQDLGKNKIFAEDKYITVLLEHFVKAQPSKTWIDGHDTLLRDPFDEPVKKVG